MKLSKFAILYKWMHKNFYWKHNIFVLKQKWFLAKKQTTVALEGVRSGLFLFPMISFDN